MKKIECGRETKAPILHYQFTDSYFRDKLIEMAFQLIKLRDKYESEEFCSPTQLIVLVSNWIDGKKNLKIKFNKHFQPLLI